MSVKRTYEFVFLITENKRIRYIAENGFLFVEELDFYSWAATEILTIKRNLNLKQVCTLVSMFERQ